MPKRRGEKPLEVGMQFKTNAEITTALRYILPQAVLEISHVNGSDITFTCLETGQGKPPISKQDIWVKEKQSFVWQEKGARHLIKTKMSSLLSQRRSN